MPSFTFQQTIKQLEKRKGAYYYFKIDAETVDAYEKKRATRLVCTIENELSYSCGLNHLGDGNFFIIIATKHLKKLGLELGEMVTFTIIEDPNPLGVEVPEALAVLLEQDEDARRIFESITDGKKRSLIYSINKLKNIDKQVQKSLTFLQEQDKK